MAFRWPIVATASTAWSGGVECGQLEADCWRSDSGARYLQALKRNSGRQGKPNADLLERQDMVVREWDAFN